MENCKNMLSFDSAIMQQLKLETAQQLAIKTVGTAEGLTFDEVSGRYVMPLGTLTVYISYDYVTKHYLVVLDTSNDSACMYYDVDTLVRSDTFEVEYKIYCKIRKTRRRLMAAWPDEKAQMGHSKDWVRLTDANWKNLAPYEYCGKLEYCGRRFTEPGGCVNGCIIPKLYARLAAFEDTGFCPSEVQWVADVCDFIHPKP